MSGLFSHKKSSLTPKLTFTLQYDNSKACQSKGSRNQDQIMFAKYLQQLGNLENQIETLKRTLTNMHDFDPFEMFQYMSQKNSKLEIEQLDKIIIQQGFRMQKEDLNNIFKSYSQSDGQIWTYSNILRFLYSSEHSLLEFTKKKQYKLKQKRIDYKKLISQFIMILLKEKDYIQLVKDMNSNLYNIDVQKLFSAITCSDSILYHDLQRFTTNNNIKISKDNIQGLLHKFDLNQDGRVTITDFVNYLQPTQQNKTSSPKKKHSLQDLTIQSNQVAQDKQQFKQHISKTSMNTPDHTQSRINVSMIRQDRCTPLKLNKLNNTQSQFFQQISKKLSMTPINDNLTQLQQKQIVLKEEEQKVNYAKTQKLDSLNQSINENLFYNFLDDDINEYSENQDDIQFQSLAQQEFIKYLIKIIEGEKNIDAYRMELINNKDFDFVNSFLLFDMQQIGVVNVQQLKASLEHHISVIITQREMQLLFTKYNKDKDGLFKFSDFCSMIIPKNFTKQAANIIKDKFKEGSILSRLKYSTIQDLKQLIEQIISYEMDLEMIRIRLSTIQNDSFDQEISPIDSIISSLNQQQSDQVTSQQIQSYMAINGNYFASDKEIHTLIKRFDKEKKGFISYEDIITELTPINTFKV